MVHDGSDDTRGGVVEGKGVGAGSDVHGITAHAQYPSNSKEVQECASALDRWAQKARLNDPDRQFLTERLFPGDPCAAWRLVGEVSPAVGDPLIAVARKMRQAIEAQDVKLWEDATANLGKIMRCAAVAHTEDEETNVLSV